MTMAILKLALLGSLRIAFLGQVGDAASYSATESSGNGNANS